MPYPTHTCVADDECLCLFVLFSLSDREEATREAATKKSGSESQASVEHHVEVTLDWIYT